MIAVDTNVLIYACDQADPREGRSRPRHHARDGVLLWQAAVNFSPRLANLTNRDSPRRTLGIAWVNSAICCLLGSPLMATWLGRKSSISREERRCGMP